MKIRRLTSNDLESVYSIMRENHSSGLLNDGDKLTDEQYAALMCRSVESLYVLGVFIEDDLACIFWHIPMSNSIYCRHSNMNVRYRGKGLYTTMVKEVTERVLGEGKYILSMVPASNQHVIKSLTNNSFTHAGTLPGCYRLGDKVVDIEMYWRS